MELALILDIVTATAVFLGIVFGLIQLRHFHLSQEREASLILLNSFRTGELFQGIWIIQDLPPGLPKSEVDARLGDEMKWVYLVMRTWEVIGALVFTREISIEIVEHAFGEPILLSWQRLGQYVADLRADMQRETTFEWFQWISERIVAQAASSTRSPAHIAYQDWK